MTNVFLPLARFISSLTLTRIIIAGWTLHIWGSIWYLAPGPDDAAFISQAMGFIFHGDLGTMYFDRFQLFFLNMPGYAFMQAIFYTVWNTMGLPLNIFTYKIFHLGSISLLLYFSCRLIMGLSKSDHQTGRFRINIFLLLLAVSPFVIDGLYPRPEPLGLLITVLGLLLFQSAENGRSERVQYVWASVCFGIAMAMHPTFILISGSLCAFAGYYLAKNGKILTLALCAFAASIPLLLVILWLWGHAPESFDMLGEHIRQRSDNSGDIGRGLWLMIEFAILLHPGSIAVKLYYAICFSTLSLGLVSLFVVLARRIASGTIKSISAPHAMAVIFGLASFANIAISSSPRIQLYTVLGFGIMFTLSTFVKLPGPITEDGEA